MNTGRINIMGSGTSTSGLAFGGDPGPGASTNNEEWNGDGITTQTID